MQSVGLVRISCVVLLVTLEVRCVSDLSAEYPISICREAECCSEMTTQRFTTLRKHARTLGEPILKP